MKSVGEANIEKRHSEGGEGTRSMQSILQMCEMLGDDEKRSQSSNSRTPRQNNDKAFATTDNHVPIPCKMTTTTPQAVDNSLPSPAFTLNPRNFTEN